MSTFIKTEIKTGESNLLLKENIPAYTFSPAAILKIEKEILGIYVSAHPLSIHRQKIPEYLSSGYLYIRSSHIEQLRPSQHVAIAGLLIQVRRQFTKNGEIMAFLLLEDETGLFEAIAFPKTFQRYFSLLVKDALLLLEGNTGNKVREEKIIIDKISNINSNSRINTL
jgi:DNA polymerase III subunit alpha